MLCCFVEICCIIWYAVFTKGDCYMKKLFYVLVLLCVMGISFVGCSGSTKNVSFLEASNEQVNKEIEKIDKTKFLSFKIEDNRIMFTPDDYKNNFNLIAESLKYNKINEFTEGSFGDEYSSYTTHDFDLDKNTKLRLAQSDNDDVGYRIIMVEHTIQPEDADNNFLDFGNACFVSALACTDIENQEDLKSNISHGLSDAINNKGEEIQGILDEEFEYGFQLKDNIITFYALVSESMNNLNIEDVTNEYPKIKDLEKMLDEKYTFLNEYEIKIRTDKESWLNLHYIAIKYAFDAETSVEDRVKTILFITDEINQLLGEDVSVSYFIEPLKESEYPNLNAFGKMIQPNNKRKKLLTWYIHDEAMSGADKDAILDQIDDIVDNWK